MKIIIVYYPFPLREQSSGSAVRPVKMLEAFEKLAHSHNGKIGIISIYGETKERAKSLQRIYKEINPRDILFCYMENSTLPLWLTDHDHIPREPLLEISFLRFLKKNRIPVGLFYRDIYWKFKEEYPLKGIRRAIMKMVYLLEMNVYKKFVHHFFLPSIQMNDYIGIDDSKVSALPPGGVDKLALRQSNSKKNMLNVIYVGGISERYGLREMLGAFEILNGEGHKAILHLVCRKKEYEEFNKIIAPYEKYLWLNVYHAFGEELDRIYAKADVALIAIKNNHYNNFAVPVKLFEYISYGLPIVSTDCTAQAEIINKNRLGKVTSDNSKDIAKGISQFLDKQVLDEYASNVNNALLKEHLWYNRAESVYNILMDKREN